MKSVSERVAGLLMVMALVGVARAQTGSQGVPGKANGTAQAASVQAATTGQAKSAPLRLQSLDPDGKADPFPAVNPKNFTTDSPSVAQVEGYLHAMLGYDANRIWRVAAIQKTAAPGVAKVVALISEKSPNAKVLTAVFYTLPDGKHMVADSSGVQPFGQDPFAANRAVLQARADGPSHGAAGKDLLLVEFADLQCPHCKDAQTTMNNLAKDFPKARIVYENYPLTTIHPFAYRAAAYGACIAQTNSDAFFTYAQAVYETQGALTAETGEETLKNAAMKAGMNAETVATCASSANAKKSVDASTLLATDLGIDQTPMLAVNGRLLALNSLPYETLKTLIVFQAGLDGASAATAGTPLVSAPGAAVKR